MSVNFVPQVLQRTLRSLCLVLLTASVLVGCNDQATRNGIDNRAAEATKAMVDMDHYNYSPAKRYNPLVVTDKIWMGNSAVRMHRGLPLPDRFEKDNGVTLISSDPMTLADIATAISTQTGISVHMSDVGAAAARPGAGAAQTMQIAYEGPLSGLMEKVSGYFGVSWRYDGSILSVARFETRVFVIEALPGSQETSESTQDTSSGGSGGGGGSGGSSGSSGGGGTTQSSLTQSATFKLDLKYWDELNQVLASMLGGTGTVVTSPSLGTVTITSTPEVMHTVAGYIEKENQRLSSQIAINVEIYTVSLTDGTDFNIAFSTALRQLKNLGVNFTGVPAPGDVSGFVGSSTLSTAILNPDRIGAVTDIFKAISGLGDTTKVAKFPLVTLNNRPVSRRVGSDVAYVRSAQANNTSTGATTGLGTSITPDTIKQGFQVQLTPRLLEDGRILLQYSLEITDIKSIASFNSQTGSSAPGDAGSSTIQLPLTLERSFVQQSVLRSGSTLFMGGAEEEDLSQNSQGVGDPFNYILGGGTSTNRTHTMLFMAITPQVLVEPPHSEND